MLYFHLDSSIMNRSDIRFIALLLHEVEGAKR